MKFLVILSVAVACVAAASLEASAPVVRANYEINPDNSYIWSFETGNGIYAQEKGSLKNINKEHPFIEANGAYKYSSPEGTPIELNYIANENGFQPQGAHLPVGPAIPEAIIRSLEYIRTHAPKPQ